MVRVRFRGRVGVRDRAAPTKLQYKLRPAWDKEEEHQIISLLEIKTLQVRELIFWSPLWHLENKLNYVTIPALFQLIWCVQPFATTYKSPESIHTVI